MSTNTSCSELIDLIIAHAYDESLLPRNRLQGVIARLWQLKETHASENDASTAPLGEAAIRELRGLEQTAVMLEKQAPEIFPEVKEGKVHFGRAVMESAADAIRQAWANVIAAGAARKPRCTCYVLPHADDCDLLVGITQSGERVFADEQPLDKVGEEINAAIELARRWKDDRGPDQPAKSFGMLSRALLELDDVHSADLRTLANLECQLEMVDAALNEVGAPVNDEWEELVTKLSRRGRIARLSNSATGASESRAKTALAWAQRIFGDIAIDPQERAMRFVEEAIELGYAVGLPASTARTIAKRVYADGKGGVVQELGQAMFTLELLAGVLGLSLDERAAAEFARVQSVPREEWQRRHKAKIDLGIAK